MRASPLVRRALGVSVVLGLVTTFAILVQAATLASILTERLLDGATVLVLFGAGVLFVAGDLNLASLPFLRDTALLTTASDKMQADRLLRLVAACDSMRLFAARCGLLRLFSGPRRLCCIYRILLRRAAVET